MNDRYYYRKVEDTLECMTIGMLIESSNSVNDIYSSKKHIIIDEWMI